MANTSSKPIIKDFGIQTGTDRTVFATWTWSKDHTDHYQVKWYYATGDSVWFEGENTTVNIKQSTYSAPSNATKVKLLVKAVSKTHKVTQKVKTKNSKGKTVTKTKSKDQSYWVGKWSTEKIYRFKNEQIIGKLNTPTVSIKGFELTATIDNIPTDINATGIEWYIIEGNWKFKSIITNLNKTSRSATYKCFIKSGYKYRVRVRGVKGIQPINIFTGEHDKADMHGEWSEYSNEVTTVPKAPRPIISLKAKSETEVLFDWTNVSNCTGYEVQYTTEKRFFDSSPDNVKSLNVDSVVGHAEITGLETGKEYFFRVRAKNDMGESTWVYGTKSIILGKTPSAPTTWSSTSTASIGEQIILYWVHNTEDGSAEETAIVEITINGQKHEMTVPNDRTGDDKYKTSSIGIGSLSYGAGAKILWRVKTCGITGKYSPWSTQRTINVYAPPTLTINVSNSTGQAINSSNPLTSFPLLIKSITAPDTQKTMGYKLSVISINSYVTIDSVGNEKVINAGDEIYSKYIDTNNELNLKLSAGDIDFENNKKYRIECDVSKNSGLHATDTETFKVSWADIEYEPNIDIGYDADSYSVILRPYCADDTGKLVNNVTLSVYRREYDGGFTEIATDLENTNNIYLTDIHPALDFARYRIVAETKTTGAISYFDADYYIGEDAVIIQWDEQWSQFTVSESDESDDTEESRLSGSLIRLPYNIDVSDKGDVDVSLVEYIGRKRPVSYYGTQLGETATWKVEIEKDDKETLYALRRLKIYAGDVYVREPSGSGYWANIKVSFSQTHCELTIPVTLELTRVEGGK